MKLGLAKEKAEKIRVALEPFCSRIVIAGSIRRQKPEVKDIDIVLIPSDPLGLNAALKSLGRMEMGGDKLRRFSFVGTQVDIYFATEDNWATLLLIRTGSKESNMKLCSLAKSRGWKLCAGGEGLFNQRGERIAGDSEESIYQALGLPFQEPWERG